MLEPKNPMVHVYAGNLLMTTGSYEDATKAFTNADNIHKSPLALYQRSRCYVALNKLKDSLKDLNKVVEISPNDKIALSDRDCISALHSCIGPSHSDMSIFGKAVVTFTKLINYESNANLQKAVHNSSIVY